MDDLVVWLRAQMDDDERDIEAAIVVALEDLERDGLPSSREDLMTQSSWPRRAELEVEAKRRILDLHSSSHECSTFESSCDWFDGDGDACSTLLLLALPYSDRPGYRDVWKP